MRLAKDQPVGLKTAVELSFPPGHLVPAYPRKYSQCVGSEPVCPDWISSWTKGLQSDWGAQVEGQVHRTEV